MHNEVIVTRIDADTFDVWPAATEHGAVAHGRVEQRSRRGSWKGSVQTNDDPRTVKEAGSRGECLHAVIENMLGH